MPEFFNFMMVKVGSKYSADYVNRMWSMASRYTDLNLEPYCFTDNPSGIHRDINILMAHETFTGYWNKLLLFSQWAPRGWTLYMDLDQIILGNITHLVSPPQKPFTCYADHIEWDGCKVGSAMMIYQQENYKYLWDRFKASDTSIVGMVGGDQAFIEENIPADDIHFLNPAEIASFKYDLNMGPPTTGVRIVNFHGEPKQGDLITSDKWIEESWH